MRTKALTTPLDGFIVHPVRTKDDKYALEQWLQYEERVGMDTETNGLDFYDACRIIQLGSTTEAWVFTPDFMPELVRDIVRGHMDLICHHAAFDATAVALAHAANEGQPHRDVSEDVRQIMAVTTDTQILSHLIDPRTQHDGGVGHGLKPLCDHYLGGGAIDGQTALKDRFKELGLTNSQGWKQIDTWDEVYVTYAGLDAGLTVRLEQLLAAEVAELELTNLADLEHEVARICAGMTAKGMCVDLAHTQDTLNHLEQETLKAQREAKLYGVENVNSTKQVADALIVRGVTLTKKTKTGAWQVDKEVLDGLDDPVATAVKAAKQAGKAKSSWVEPILTQGLKDGRSHPRIRPLGAKTGRMSVHSPALQQLPTGDWRVRTCLTASEGKTLVAVDYSQVEVRCMAYLAGEEKLIKAFNEGLDVHSTIAAQLYGDNFTPEQRSLSKGAVFAKLYGAGPKRLSIQTGVTQVEAQQVMAGLDRAFPRLARWSSKTVETAKFNGGFVHTPSGRRLPVERGAEYKVVNYITQATAADLFKGALVELSMAGYEDNMVMVIHDEILFETEPDTAEQFGKDVAEVMSGMLGQVPIVAEPEVVGFAWGDKYRPEEAQQ
tara:strand:+ start:5805 stop:7622 length:1818 start_codon:yes stop_codon:yes gene_type:complete